MKCNKAHEADGKQLISSKLFIEPETMAASPVTQGFKTEGKKQCFYLNP